MALEKQLIHDLVGQSEALNSLLRFIGFIAPSSFNVLVLGENGTGKELAVQAIHRNSSRSAFPLIVVNCAAVSKELLESEWFGHEKGSFTGAAAQKTGLFELAHNGTLFLDEIGEIPLEIQAKLLRVIEYSQFRRVGGLRDIHVDVRVIAATNRDLESAVRRGLFREDLYHRLPITFRMPSLRQRRDDIPLLAQHFISMLGADGKAAAGKPVVTGLSPEALSALCKYDWPGNVRQLRNVVLCGILFASRETIQLDDLHMDFLNTLQVTQSAVPEPALLPAESLDEVLLRIERNYVEDAHKRVNGDPARLAQLVNVHRAGLPRYLDRLGLSHLKHPRRYRPAPGNPEV